MAHLPDLKGSNFTLSVLHLDSNDIEKVTYFLNEKKEKAPNFFNAAPIVIDISQVQDTIDFHLLHHAIVNVGFIPVGITGCSDTSICDLAKKAGFAIMHSGKTKVQSQSENIASMIISAPVRSGQRIYAENCDLIILAHVNEGAEVIADGSIYIYGTLRGRATAGAKGLAHAHIICNNLQAELISIANYYCLSEQIDSKFWQQAVMIKKSQDSLIIEAFIV